MMTPPLIKLRAGGVYLLRNGHILLVTRRVHDGWTGIITNGNQEGGKWSDVGRYKYGFRQVDWDVVKCLK